jgi:hypothetical protein
MQSKQAVPPETTLRAQAKGEKAGKSKNILAPEGDRARMDRSTVKAVLASPLIIPWYALLHLHITSQLISQTGPAFRIICKRQY